jgi:hypothetical protein
VNDEIKLYFLLFCINIFKQIKSKRNIYLKGGKRVILGEIGFANEIEHFKEDSISRENTLYYPNEYFLSDCNEEIKLSFDIW